MSKIDLGSVPARSGSSYPDPYGEPCAHRQRIRLGDAAGLTQFGVNLLKLPPGQWSSQRHWHEQEDEFVYVIDGEVVLVSEDGEELLRPGDCAGFPAGDKNGHHLQNRSSRVATVLEIGSRRPDEDAVDYPDIDLQIRKGAKGYSHRDGKLY
jgi:uncharacterized cupin superfamily protein